MQDKTAEVEKFIIASWENVHQHPFLGGLALKVLGIMGSPRIKGNTDLLLEEALKGAKSQGAEVEKIVVDKLKIAPCKEYLGCFKDGNCVIRDDMDDIYPKLLGADVVIIASPMFFYGVSSQAKALIDRCQALWARKHILKQSLPNSGRKGAFIAVGATKGKRLFEGAILTVKYFFEAIGVEYADELLIRGVDARGEIKEHPIALSDAFELGRRLAQAKKA
ncbi:MAG: flavodoxin family protein [Chloroflexi bacterium]|nr:flavodoxin family protein [Chloroflexota bacterium]